VGRLAIIVAIRFVIGEFGVVTGSQAGGTVGLVLFVVGGLVLLYTAALALYLVTVAAEVVPEELHIVWPIRRTRYRLRPGAVTRLRTIRRRGLFKAELGGFGIEFGQGTSEDGEQLSVIRLDPRVPLNLVPTEHARLAIAVEDEATFVRALVDATRLRLKGRGIRDRPLGGAERSRRHLDRG
jgi:hypothetical protein